MYAALTKAGAKRRGTRVRARRSRARLCSRLAARPALSMAMATRDEIDMRLRTYVKSDCAPIWWEQGRQVVVNSGSMWVIKTSERLFGTTNCHVLMTYEKHRAEKPDIFCQLGSAPFDPVANQCRAVSTGTSPRLRFPIRRCST